MAEQQIDAATNKLNTAAKWSWIILKVGTAVSVLGIGSQAVLAENAGAGILTAGWEGIKTVAYNAASNTPEVIRTSTNSLVALAQTVGEVSSKISGATAGMAATPVGP